LAAEAKAALDIVPESVYRDSLVTLADYAVNRRR
jgi:geranylgeranyl pyrophosphate synthase